jgi:hypothetical protein
MYGRIGDEIQDAALQTQVQRAIQDAIAVYEPTRFHFNQTTGTFQTVAGQEYYTGADFADIPLLIEIDSLLVSIMGVKSPLQANDYQEMNRVQNGAWYGPPRAYSYYGQQLRLYPIPDAVYPLIMSYHHRLTPLALAPDTNAWMTDGEMLIRQTAKSYLALDVLQEAGLAQGAQMLADMAFNRLRMETRKRRSNPLLKTDLPSHWSHGDVRSGEVW